MIPSKSPKQRGTAVSQKPHGGCRASDHYDGAVLPFLSHLDDAARIQPMKLPSAAKRSFLCITAGLLISHVQPVQAQQSDPCKLGSDAFQRRDLPQAEALLKQCITAKPPQINPYLDLCALYQMQGKTKALHDVSLEVPGGSFVAIAGVSGSGKSTLLECLSGVTPPSEGQVFIDGVELYPNLRGCRRAIGYV